MQKGQSLLAAGVFQAGVRTKNTTLMNRGSDISRCKCLFLLGYVQQWEGLLGAVQKYTYVCKRVQRGNGGHDGFEIRARPGTLTERVAKVETATDFLRSDVRNLNENVCAQVKRISRAPDGW